MRWLPPLLAVALLAGCAGAPKRPAGNTGAGAGATPGVAVPPPRTADAGAADCAGFKPYPPAQEDPSTRGNYVAGGLYRPGVSDSTPDYIPRVHCIPEPQVLAEPRSAYGNRSPYQVLGRSYHVLDSVEGFVESGVASYYGNKFHGRRTSNQEVYDMYAFTAAHKSLPLPSFARVTNLDNGRSVVVRVNDRGPFHEGRVVDLSYAAAVKLDIHRQGTGRVEVRALLPGETGMPGTALAAAPRPAPAQAAPPSSLDRLVGTLPQAAAVVAAAPPAQPVQVAQAAPPATGAPPASPAAVAARVVDRPGYGLEENRFRMVAADGRVRTADEFDAWMRERQARHDASRTVPGTAPSSPPVVQQSAPPATAPAPMAAAATALAPASTLASGSGTTLQVGVYSVRDNAERALAALRAAGIAAHLQDVTVADRRLWRVRVGPVAAAALADLSSRVAGLGLGMPQVVRE